ncbi:unnamed protein product [Paramecium sonneborni]|uniref:Uncharacterized protein n=1 Tax=Paramecium sonneborni TaxID=65129 RepID=A0A8S1RGQ8_9CILI|nr:unnamed protein product [Paramecium sonneborni]
MNGLNFQTFSFIRNQSLQQYTNWKKKIIDNQRGMEKQLQKHTTQQVEFKQAISRQKINSSVRECLQNKIQLFRRIKKQQNRINICILQRIQNKIDPLKSEVQSNQKQDTIDHVHNQDGTGDKLQKVKILACQYQRLNESSLKSIFRCFEYSAFNKIKEQ